MRKQYKLTAMMMALVLVAGLSACSSGNGTSESNSEENSETTVSNVGKTNEMTAIEEALNLASMDAEWTYSDSADAWTLSIVTAVT